MLRVTGGQGVDEKRGRPGNALSLPLYRAPLRSQRHHSTTPRIKGRSNLAHEKRYAKAFKTPGGAAVPNQLSVGHRKNGRWSRQEAWQTPPAADYGFSPEVDILMGLVKHLAKEKEGCTTESYLCPPLHKVSVADGALLARSPTLTDGDIAENPRNYSAGKGISMCQAGWNARLHHRARGSLSRWLRISAFPCWQAARRVPRYSAPPLVADVPEKVCVRESCTLRYGPRCLSMTTVGLGACRDIPLDPLHQVAASPADQSSFARYRWRNLQPGHQVLSHCWAHGDNG